MNQTQSIKIIACSLTTRNASPESKAATRTLSIAILEVNHAE